MKFLTFFLFLATSSGYSYAQETDKTKVYEVQRDIPIWACDLLGNRINPNEGFSIPPNEARFSVIKIKNDTVVIRFLKWEGKKVESIANRKNFNDIITYNNSDSSIVKRYFFITKYDLDSNCIKAYARWHRSAVFTLGLVTMPMKLRLGSNFDFQGNLSLGTTAGAKIRISRYNPNYVNLLFGASISTILLDSFSTKGIISGQPLTNIAVFSPSLGVVFEFGKAQAGFFTAGIF